MPFVSVLSKEIIVTAGVRLYESSGNMMKGRENGSAFKTRRRQV